MGMGESAALPQGHSRRPELSPTSQELTSANREAPPLPEKAEAQAGCPGLCPSYATDVPVPLTREKQTLEPQPPQGPPPLLPAQTRPTPGPDVEQR